MAHEIDTTTGKAAIFCGNGQKPWHGLGTVIAGQATSAEAIKLATLDWRVEQAIAYATIGGELIDSGSRLNYRDDTNAVLGTVGSQYKPLQNVDAFAFMDSIVGNGAAAYDTAGALFGGRKVWMLAKLPKVIKTTRKDVTEAFILLTNAHDGSESMRFFLTTTRVVCNNTLTLALNTGDGSRGNGITYRHTGGLMDRLEQAKEYLGIIDLSLDKLADATQRLHKAKMTTAQVADYANSLFPSDSDECARLLNRMADEQTERASIMRELLNGHEAMTDRTRKENAAIVEMILANHENERQAVAGRGTAWTAYNSVSEWVDHQNESKTAEKHFESTTVGNGNAIKMDAFDLAMSYATTA